MLRLKLTPLTRLTAAFDAELSLMADSGKEEALASKYLARLHDAAARRDSTLKGMFVLDALLAIATSGKNVTIPGVGISMADIPALMEVLIGMVAIAAYICSQSFTNWLCYSQIHFGFSNRIARRYGIDPDLLELAEITSEPALKMMSAKLNIWGVDWHTPTKPFRLVAKLYDIGNNLFFLMLPLLHCLLMFHAVMRVVSTSDIGVTHVVFFAWVTVAHMLALLVWVVPMLGFTFTIESASADITDQVPEGAE